MHWTYKITAQARPRVLMRLAQLFDQQLVAIQSCHLVTIDDRLEIIIAIDTDAELAHRLHAKLWKHCDLLNVDLLVTDPHHSGGVNRPSTAVHPPSTIVSVPVTNDPASDAR
jgi:hypothetical protein